MISVIPQTGLGDVLGAGIGQGIAQGLERKQTLADKLSLMEQEQKGTLAEKLQANYLKQQGEDKQKDLLSSTFQKFGYSQPLSEALADLEPSIRGDIFKGSIKARLNGLPDPLEELAFQFQEASGGGDLQQPTQRPRPDKPTKPSKFQEVVESKLADEYTKNEQKIETLEAGKSDIDYLKNQVSDVRSLAGIAGTYSGLGESGPRFDAVATTLLEPIIKIYNPAGVLAQSKLQFLKDTFIPNAKDTKAKINGKLEALDKFYQKALDVANKRNRMISQSEGRLSPENYNKILENETKQLDNFAQQYANLSSSPEEEEMVTGLVSISNGKKLKPLSKEQAQDLIDKGLVEYGT